MMQLVGTVGCSDKGVFSQCDCKHAVVKEKGNAVAHNHFCMGRCQGAALVSVAPAALACHQRCSAAPCVAGHCHACARPRWPLP